MLYLLYQVTKIVRMGVMRMRRLVARICVLNTRSVVHMAVACIRKQFATVSRTASMAPTKTPACARQLIAKSVHDTSAGWSQLTC